jgi:hypothetical protein
MLKQFSPEIKLSPHYKTVCFFILIYKREASENPSKQKRVRMR